MKIYLGLSYCARSRRGLKDRHFFFSPKIVEFKKKERIFTRTIFVAGFVATRRRRAAVEAVSPSPLVLSVTTGTVSAEFRETNASEKLGDAIITHGYLFVSSSCTLMK